MERRWVIGGGLAVLLGLAALGWRYRLRRALPPSRPPLDRAALAVADPPLSPPAGPLRVYHLGHSLVGRDMPAMLAQLAGHDHASQLGWGASLRNHWDGPAAVPGFATENDHPHHQPARAALASGGWDAVILTEMVELRDAIRWHGSAHYLARWAQAAQAGNPDVRLYLYETWHERKDPAAWSERIATDLPVLWEGELLQGALAWDAPPIRIIPGGQVLDAAMQAATAGMIPGITAPEDFMARLPDDGHDPIHLGDLGNYLMALTHYAVLYHQPAPAPGEALRRADGAVVDLAPETAATLQDIVWQVVRATARTGVAP